MLKPYLLCLALLLSLLGGAGWTWADESPEPRFHAAILLYHHVSSSTPPSISVSPRQFIEHLNVLEAEEFQIWPLARVMQHLQRRRPLPDRIAVITFDGAYASLYDHALPVLRQRGIPFTIFVNGRFIEEARPLYMTWAQLREAQASGATLANHSWSHPFMIRREEGENLADWQARMRTEIEDNQRLLEARLERTLPRFFAYPYGEFNPELQALLASMRYSAFSHQSGPASLFSPMTAQPRYALHVGNAHPAALRSKLYALPFPVIEQQPASAQTEAIRPRPSWVITLEAGDYQLNQLRCHGPQARLLSTHIERLEERRVRITVTDSVNLPVGRSTYVCMAPHRHENRHFRIARQWITPHPDGSWPAR